MVYKGRLVCCYSDENDYTGFDPTTGVATLDPADDTATDSQGQVLVHGTWDGHAAQWSDPVVDIAGLTQDMGSGKSEIGGGRPGMTNVVRTTDGKWMITYEYWGGGANTRYQIASNPLEFFKGSATDLGNSAGAYHQLFNRRTDQVMGTGNKTNDADLGNADVPDVRLEDPGSAANPDTQFRHVVTEPGGGTTLLNKSGGRAAAIWTGNVTAGQKIGQWVDNSSTGSWNLVKTGDGLHKLQSVKNTSLYVTGATAGGQLALQTATTDGSQDWELVR